MMMTMLKMMMMMKEITSQFVLWGRAVRPNFLGAECATDDCRGKQPDHYLMMILIFMIIILMMILMMIDIILMMIIILTHFNYDHFEDDDDNNVDNVDALWQFSA